MKASDKIRIGDLVMVTYPTGEQTSNPAHSLDGQQFIVNRSAWLAGTLKAATSISMNCMGQYQTWVCRIRFLRMSL